jgi:hypothetical protein
MVGEPGKERALGDLADPADVPDQIAFLAQRIAQPGDLGIVASVREIEQDAVRPEVAERFRVERPDRRIGPAVEQRDPIIIGANMHSPLVEADLRRHLDAAMFLGRAVIRLLVKCPQAVHQAVLKLPSGQSFAPVVVEKPLSFVNLAVPKARIHELRSRAALHGWHRPLAGDDEPRLTSPAAAVRRAPSSGAPL